MKSNFLSQPALVSKISELKNEEFNEKEEKLL